MRIRAQIGMVLNLDKCIGCHTCSVTCKNVWTSRPGMEYAWFNNVESKPGIGYPKEWENQDKWNGGWIRKADGSIVPRQGGKWNLLMKIFANPNLPEIDDYYEPFTFDYGHLQSAPEMKASPTARPRSLITGKQMDKIVWGPNWEEILGGEFKSRSADRNFDDIQKEMYGEFENTFMMYLPRLCEHCLNPACVASCPSGSIYKREEDGIVLIDQDKCRGWRMCVSGCPYKKIYYNWKSGKAEKCIFCYPRIEAGQPTVCSETCVGRIRYLGVLLYDADRIQQAASVEHDRDLYQAQLDIFLDPHDPKVIAQARMDGIPDKWMEAARNSPVYKMAVEWKVALPLHPEYRTLPMVWYVPPLSPISAAANAGHLGHNGEIPDVNQLRIPVKYLANLLTAGDTVPVVRALERMLAMRAYQRSKHVDQAPNLAVLDQVGISQAMVEEMYHVMAIANYEDRFVIPTHAPRIRREHLQRARRLRLLLRQRLLRRHQRSQPVWQRHEAHHPHQGGNLMQRNPLHNDLATTLRALARLLEYPGSELRGHLPELRAALHGARAVSRQRLAQLDALVDGLLAQGDMDAEEDYVQLFDCGRATSLHLFEHVHGDSRDRGPAMIDLAQTYEAGRPVPGRRRTARLPAGGAAVRLHPARAPGPRLPGRDGPHPQCHLQRPAKAQQPLCQACWAP
jgi:nitrate reductase beta subunit